MPIELSAPLPECIGCETPTKREVHARNGGLCTDCATAMPRPAADAAAHEMRTPYSAR